jgi:hypothetical protein
VSGWNSPPSSWQNQPGWEPQPAPAQQYPPQARQAPQAPYRSPPPGGPLPGGRPPSRDDRASERAARLTLTCLAASFAVLVVGVVVFFTVRTLREEAGGLTTPAAEDQVPLAPTPEEAARIVGGIGPPPGGDVVTYITSRKEALAAATGDRVAVVSLAKYQTEARARAAVGSAEILHLLAAAPGGQPATVTGGLSAWVAVQTNEARLERDEIQKLIPTVDDAQFKDFYRKEVERLNKLLAGIQPSSELVFAVVVRAPAPVLRELGNKAEVRLVDVGPSADPEPKPNYRGLRPEETSKANEPNTRPV